MTDEQRDELQRLRMKTCTPEMVTVPKELLDMVTMTALTDSKFCKAMLQVSGKDRSVGICIREQSNIAELRKAAGFDK